MIFLPPPPQHGCLRLLQGSSSCVFAVWVRRRGWVVDSRRRRAGGTQPQAEDARPAGGRTGRSSERGQVEERLTGDGGVHSAPAPRAPSFRGCFGPRNPSLRLHIPVGQKHHAAIGRLF